MERLKPSDQVTATMPWSCQGHAAIGVRQALQPGLMRCAGQNQAHPNLASEGLAVGSNPSGLLRSTYWR